MTTILIVDDVAENRYLLVAVFEGNGYDVVSAQNGAEALELALESPPDLIVTDILMPVMDGFELCRRWKTDERLHSIPFVFYTATYTDPSDEQFALSLGAERFVVKPQKSEVLAKLVREVLDEAKRRQVPILDLPLGEEMEVLRHHNEALFRKLEKKVLQLQAEIEERKRIQAAFEESQARLFEAHRLAHIGVWDWDADADTVTWSEELYRIAGIDPRDPAPSFAEQPRLYTPESWTLLTAAVGETLRTGKSYQLELEFIRADGTRRWVNALGSPKRDRSGRVIGLHGMVQDITERKRAETERAKLEDRLRIAQKMEAIGSLAGGVAHDFNNLLSVILSYTEFAVDELPEGSSPKEDLLEVRKAAQRAVALTRQLLAFGRKQILQPVPLNLNQIVTETEKMLRRILGEDIDFVQVLAPDLGVVVADPGQLEQVLLNLVVNARDAMPRGGRITVETANVEIGEEYAEGHMATKPGSYVLLAVTDTGSGMDKQTMSRLFEPFFTTKERGKGTGLGLSMVYGMVKQSGGNIWVYSEPGVGTTFKIYLPQAFVAATTIVRSSMFPSRSTGSETILVVEDEDALRKVARRALEGAGYRVLAAEDGDEALLVCARYAGNIHLLLTDVVMPRMSGRALAEALCKTRPTLKVIYMSGFTDDAMVHHGVLEAGTHFLAKPFTSNDVTRKVREVLDAGTVSLSGDG